MKVVAFIGSGNKKGNTTAAVKRVLEGMAERNIETEIFHLTDYFIKPCLGCRYCETTHACRLEGDDIPILHQAIREAQGIILGTPTYYGDITGQFKQFVDRVYPFIDIRKDPVARTMTFGSIIKKEKLGMLVAVSGTHGAEVFDSHVKVAGHCFNDIHTRLWHSLLIPNTSWEPVKEGHPVWREAYELGEKFGKALAEMETEE